MNNAAFFDIDGTLIKCYSQNILMKNLFARHVLNAGQVFRISMWFMLYRFGLVVGSSRLRRACYVVFSRRSREEIDSIFIKTVNDILSWYKRKEMEKIVAGHNSKKDYLFAISSSLAQMCIPIANAFGIKNVFSTELKMVNGYYTGAWRGELLEGNEKAYLIKKLAQQYAIDLSSSSAYADSCSDLPMLEIVGNPVAVDPDPQLKKIACKRKWQIILPYV